MSHKIKDTAGLNASSDETAVDRILAGDIEAFERVVERWQGPLMNLAWRYCHDRSQAEELAQDCFLQIYRSLASWRREAAFSTWMFTVATNVIRNRMRRRLPPQVNLDDAPAWALVQDPVAAAERRDLRAQVRSSVRFLPARYRDVVVAYYFQDMDVGRAAECLGLSPGTLKARLHRARALLARRLEAFVQHAEAQDGDPHG